MSRSPVEMTFRDRGRMEDAVHALVARGVRRDHIRVAQVSLRSGAVHPASPPNRGATAGAVVGALLGGVLVLVLVVRSGAASEAPVMLGLLRVLGAAMTGALLGSVVGAAFARPRRVDEAFEPPRDFLVRVDERDPEAAAHVRDALARAGGEPLGAT